MIARLILPILLIATMINGQSEEFLRLRKELEDRIAALRPEAREVAERLKAVFEARLPKEEAKTRLNAVLESASDEAKAALETLKPNHKIDVEVVIHLPEEPAETDGEAERILEKIAVPGIDRIAATAERLNLTDKALAEALKDPNLAAQLGVDRAVLGKIQHLAEERGLVHNTVDNVLHTLRNNLSSVLKPEERTRLEKFVAGKNISSLEQLFESRLGAGAPKDKPDGRGEVDRAIDKIRNGTDEFLGGRVPSNHPGGIVDGLFNGTDGDFVEKIKQRFGNDSSFLDKLNATGDFGFLGEKVSEKNLGVLLEGFKNGNFSVLDRLFNGTDSNGTLSKIKEAFKSGNFSALLGGSSGKNGSAILDGLKSMLTRPAPVEGAANSPPGDEGALANFGSSISSSLKNLFG